MNATERQVGIAAVQAAARLCAAVRAEMVGSAGAGQLDKQDRSPVTIADFGAQALVCRQIREAFPDDVIVAEEDSVALRQPKNAGLGREVARFVGAEIGPVDPEQVCDWIDLGGGEPEGRYWVLDPIDGTKGFLRDDQYAVALALIEDGTVQRGFLACPALPREGGRGLIVAAGRGEGCQALALDGTPLGPVRVSDVTEPAQARLAESVEAAHTNLDLSVRLKAALGIRAESVRMDSQAKYATLALGRADLYLRAPNPATPDYRENVWDHAAGWLVVQEAGGQVSDVYGRPLEWSRGRRLEANVGVVGSNGRLHQAVLSALSTLLPSA